ncbi:hypothetical protein [Actinosynnema sp. NPDC020468]
MTAILFLLVVLALLVLGLERNHRRNAPATRHFGSTGESLF